MTTTSMPLSSRKVVTTGPPLLSPAPGAVEEAAVAEAVAGVADVAVTDVAVADVAVAMPLNAFIEA
jgi:hypothetical protein